MYNCLSTSRSEEQDIKQNTDQGRRRLRDLEASRSNKMRRFGAWVPELIARIDKAFKDGRFHKKPRGPLGTVPIVGPLSHSLFETLQLYWPFVVCLKLLSEVEIVVNYL